MYIYIYIFIYLFIYVCETYNLSSSGPEEYGLESLEKRASRQRTAKSTTLRHLEALQQELQGCGCIHLQPHSLDSCVCVCVCWVAKKGRAVGHLPGRVIQLTIIINNSNDTNNDNNNEDIASITK